jgi:hypothetical protein
MRTDPDSQASEQARLSCARCDDAIGVYEPLVYVDDQGQTVRTSRLRLPDDVRAAAHATSFFHAECILDQRPQRREVQGHGPCGHS